MTLRSVHYLTGKYQLIRPAAAGAGGGGSARSLPEVAIPAGAAGARCWAGGAAACCRVPVPGGGRRGFPVGTVVRGWGRPREGEPGRGAAPLSPPLPRPPPVGSHGAPACPQAPLSRSRRASVHRHAARHSLLSPTQPLRAAGPGVPGGHLGTRGLSLLACCRLLQPAEVKVTKGRRPAAQQRLPLPVRSPAPWQTLVLGGENLHRCSQTGLFYTPMLETSNHPK